MRWNEREEKWTERVVAEIYTTVLPTTYLKNIIFKYSIGEFSKVCQLILNFALKFLNDPPEFS
jgi:hypothetical protein